MADDASHGGYIAGGINVTYTDEGANGQPPLTTQVQHVVQIRRQQVEFAQEQSGTRRPTSVAVRPIRAAGRSATAWTTATGSPSTTA